MGLGNNNLTGEFPSVPSYRQNLITLDISNNSLSGELPSWFGHIFPRLVILQLQSNMLQGAIPWELSLLGSLVHLDLSNNKFSGSIPHGLGNITGMQRRGIGKDESTSSTVQLVITLAFPLTENIWNGTHHVERSISFFERVHLALSIWFDWKGQYYNFLATKSFPVGIDLSCNSLSNEIPGDLAALTAVRFLNFSGNHLNGTIPDIFAGLTVLESMDLSLNNLSGPIAQSLSLLDSLDFLNLSHNCLSGEIPTGRQIQTLTDPSIYEGNCGLCGPPLNNNCSANPAPNLQPKDDDDEAKPYGMWFYFAIPLGFVFGFWGLIGAVTFHKPWRFACIRSVDSIPGKLF